MDEERRDDEMRPGRGAGGGLTPELLEWARQEFSEEEIVAALREMKENGGLELREFIEELEQVANPREGPADREK